MRTARGRERRARPTGVSALCACGEGGGERGNLRDQFGPVNSKSGSRCLWLCLLRGHHRAQQRCFSVLGLWYAECCAVQTKRKTELGQAPGLPLRLLLRGLVGGESLISGVACFPKIC